MRSLFHLLSFSFVGIVCNAYVSSTTQFPPLPLPAGVTSSFIDTTNSSGLVFHYLSAGCESSDKKPLVLVLHGFPEIAYGFKDMLVPIAEQGYCVVAPDQRGYGRTTGWDTRSWAYTDLSQWTFENLVRDMVCLVWALGYEQVFSVVGHDFGTIPTAWAGLTRPDVFRSVVLMSVPFVPPAQPPFDVGSSSSSITNTSIASWPYSEIEYALEHLSPPRRNYQWFNSQNNAAQDYLLAPALGGLHNFFKIETYLKSAQHLSSYPPPHKLASAAPSSLAVIPYFYFTLANETFTENLATLYKGFDASVIQAWFPDSDVDVYVSEFQRTGFQGSLNYYRVLTAPPGPLTNGGLLWAGRKIDVPTFFIGGKYDWQTYFAYDAFESQNVTSSDFRGAVLLNESGHWPYIEQTAETISYITEFLGSLSTKSR